MEIVIGRTKFWCANDKMVVTAKGYGERYWGGISRGDEPDDNIGLLPDACFKKEYIEKHYESGGDFGNIVMGHTHQGEFSELDLTAEELSV